MKEMVLFSRGLIPSKGRDIVAVGWWLWTFLIIYTYSDFSDYYLKNGPVMIIFQLIMLFAIRKIPVQNGWNYFILAAVLFTFNPIYLVGWWYCRSEARIYNPKMFVVGGSGKSINRRAENVRSSNIRSSTALTVLSIGWVLRTILIGIVAIWLPAILIIFVPLQFLGYAGLKNIPDSDGWAIYFIICGLLSLEPFYFVGGILSRSEKNKQETNRMMVNFGENLTSQTQKNENDVIFRLSELKKLLDQGVITEQEFSESKRKLLEKI